MPLVQLRPFKTPRRAAASQTVQSAIVMAPTGGLNFRDPLTAMAPTDAVALTNFIPKQQGVELRGGWQVFTNATSPSGPVKSIFAYNAANPVDDKMFMAIGSDIYEITGGGSPVLSQASTGSSTGEWFTVQFSTPAQNFLLAVSPGAGYWTYSAADGWVDRTASVTGLPTDVRTVSIWKQRVWFTAQDDSSVYYLDNVDAIAGSCTSFPMGSVLRSGGYVSALVNWTMDAGVSIDDYLVVIGTQGDIGVWAGTDPSSASTFGLKGVWYIGPVPEHGTYYTTFGGDVMIVSELGLVPLSRMFNGQWSQDTHNMGPSSKIQSVFAPMVRRLRTQDQFNVFVDPNSDILVISLPPENDIYTQFVMNVATGAWGMFSNMPINCATVFNNQMYFGTEDGIVCLGLYGQQDGLDINGLNGSYVQGFIQTAFSPYNTPAQLKKFSMARSVFFGPAPPAVNTSVSTQYLTSDFVGDPAFIPGTSSLWDSGLWTVSNWAANDTWASWAGVNGIGYYGSLRLKVSGSSGTRFISSNVMTEIGGVM